MGTTNIEWATDVWNPTVGCTKVTAGCLNCYAETLDRRFHERWFGEPHVPWTVKAQKQPHVVSTEYRGPVVVTASKGRAVRLMHDRLDQPLQWRQPKDGSRRRIFVDSMSDLFHADVPDEFIARVWLTMAATPQHDYLILTKRPERVYQSLLECHYYVKVVNPADWPSGYPQWPLPNVWIGVSVTGKSETASYLDALACIPAAVRFVSYEPALAPFDFGPWMRWREQTRGLPKREPCIDWLIVGGESGPKARPFNVAWAESVGAQGKAAGVPVFVKQLGSRPWEDDSWLLGGPKVTASMATRLPAAAMRDPKGGDMNEWPAGLRVRELPSPEIRTHNRLTR